MDRTVRQDSHSLYLLFGGKWWRPAPTKRTGELVSIAVQYLGERGVLYDLRATVARSSSCNPGGTATVREPLAARHKDQLLLVRPVHTLTHALEVWSCHGQRPQIHGEAWDPWQPGGNIQQEASEALTATLSASIAKAHHTFTRRTNQGATQ